MTRWWLDLVPTLAPYWRLALCMTCSTTADSLTSNGAAPRAAPPWEIEATGVLPDRSTACTSRYFQAPTIDMQTHAPWIFSIAYPTAYMKQWRGSTRLEIWYTKTKNMVDFQTQYYAAQSIFEKP